MKAKLALKFRDCRSKTSKRRICNFLCLLCSSLDRVCSRSHIFWKIPAAKNFTCNMSLSILLRCRESRLKDLSSYLCPTCKRNGVTMHITTAKAPIRLCVCVGSSHMMYAYGLKSTLFIPTIDTTTKFVIMTIWWRLMINYAKTLHNIFKQHMFLKFVRIASERQF